MVVRFGIVFGRRLLIGGSWDRDPRPVAQPVGAVDDDPVARRETGLDLHLVAVDDTEFHRSRGDFVIVDEIDVSSGSAALDRRSRHRDDVIQGADQQSDVDELAGEKLPVRVGKFGPQFDGSRRRIDLIVEHRHVARRKLVLVGAVIGDRD